MGPWMGLSWMMDHGRVLFRGIILGGIVVGGVRFRAHFRFNFSALILPR